MHRAFKGVGRELRSYGLTVKKVPGWKERGRPGVWEPRAFFDHHTASNRKSGAAPALGIVTHGRSDLPGPLSNFHIDRKGVITLVAAGRCNHAGEGGPHKGIPEDSGNSYAVSVEIENNGIGEPYPDAVMRSVRILNAVMLRRLKRGAWFAIGHREWTPRKIDPSFSMKALRKGIRRFMKRRMR